MSKVGETGTRNQSNVSRSHNNNAHELSTFFFRYLIPDSEGFKLTMEAGQTCPFDLRSLPDFLAVGAKSGIVLQTQHSHETNGLEGSDAGN
ncbi:hypothetical protein [Bradyrhizobium sp. AUGA SZCCT0160]|uniref:hypothetical protein n=1 Tax=Bradyrhizobium sp. AUGA SZCCT0160 TaxID=2807662 RepID=UPI001BA66B76|nr:hypothetical protein [Bradyrhizobium sp. AUGA SZCCT0160]MBR1194025.1 hypothetical protein [Bradyrhizobium sp. AUGA SZCCT0160]